MGVDVNLYVEGMDPNLERLVDAEEKFAATVACADRYEGHWRSLELDTSEYLAEPRVVANVTTRYYGPGYERGHWPSIYVAIEVLRRLFHDGRVYYGGDETNNGQLVTDEMLAEVWRHYHGPDGDAYFRRKEDRR